MQTIDWSGIRAAAVALQSVNEAARRASVDLPPDEQRRFMDRVNKRAYRERWLDEAEALAISAPNTSAKPLSKKVQSGHSSLATALSDHSNRSRIGLAKAGTKAAETFAKMNGAEVIKRSKNFRDVVAGDAQLHNWNADQRPGSPLNLQVLSQNTVISVNEK